MGPGRLARMRQSRAGRTSPNEPGPQRHDQKVDCNQGNRDQEQAVRIGGRNERGCNQAHHHAEPPVPDLEQLSKQSRPRGFRTLVTRRCVGIFFHAWLLALAVFKEACRKLRRTYSLLSRSQLPHFFPAVTKPSRNSCTTFSSKWLSSVVRLPAVFVSSIEIMSMKCLASSR